MKPVMQDEFGVPDGNCFTASIASILEVELDDLRAFATMHCEAAAHWEEHEDQEHWGDAWDGMSTYLSARFNRRLVYMLGGRQHPPKGYAIGCGPGSRGPGHAVVVQDGLIVHDPHPDNTGLAAWPPEHYVVLLEVV